MKTRILIITSLFFLFCGCTKKNLTDESTTSKITPVVVNQDSNPSENKLVDELLVKKDLELFEKEDDYRLLQNENDISDKFNGPFTSLYMYEIEPLVGEGTTFEIIQNLNKENAYRVYVYSSFGQTIYTCINDTESNYWYLEKKAIFYKEPFEPEDSEENVTYFCYNEVCEKQVGRRLIKAEINTEPAVIDFKTAESLIGLINKNKNL